MQSPQELEVGRDSAPGWLQKWRRSQFMSNSCPSSLLLILTTGTTWDRLITSLVCSQMHLVCRMGIGILSTMEALEGKGSSTNKGNSMLFYPKMERRCPVSQTGDVRFTWDMNEEAPKCLMRDVWRTRHLFTWTFMCVQSHAHESVCISAAKIKLFYFCWSFFLLNFMPLKNIPKGFCLGDCPAFPL